MFEKVVESILVEYVSEWVEGLDAEKMKIALFGGKVEVRELKLKTAALDKFQLPLRVKAGTLGRLALKVPWKRLTKEAVKLVLEDVFLMVVPAHQDEMQRLKSKLPDDAQDSYAMRMRFAKQQEIRVRELFEKSKNDDTRRTSDAEDGSVATSSPNSGDTTSGWGYREKILHNILDNVSVEIKNIHIRYEDTSQVISKNPFSVGFTIHSIIINTTNANGMVTFVDRAQSHTPFVHKTLEIKQAGLYCDDTSPSIQELISTRRHKPPEDTYIIRPFDIVAKMTVNHDESTMFSIPRFQFVTDIGSILASVTEGQCNDVISAINYVSTHENYLKRIHIRKKRPKTPVKRDARSWWLYALYGVQVLYSLESKKGSEASMNMMSFKSRSTKCTWKLFGELWLQRKEYIALHKNILKGVAKKATPESLVPVRARLTELEEELVVETVVFFRLCAEREFELEESRQDSVKKLGWKARWKAGTSSSSDTSSPLVWRRLDPLEKLCLYGAVADQINASTSALTAKAQEKLNSQAIIYALDLAVTSFTFSLVEPGARQGPGIGGELGSKEFLRFELSKFMFAIFQRTNSSKISSSIQSIQMLDFSHMQSTLTGQRVPQALFCTLQDESTKSTQAADALTGDNCPQPPSRFLNFSIETSESKLKLDCRLLPFRYVHHLAVATKLQGYFVIQVELAPELRENAEEALANSSVWLNNAVFAKPPAAALRAEKMKKHDASKARDAVNPTPARVVELSVRLPVVDVFVLSSDTSPILEVKLSDLDFKTGNLSDTFAFAIDGVEVTFIDGLPAQDLEEKAPPQSSSASQLSPVGDLTSHHYQLARRKRASILRRTRIVFSGDKVEEQNKIPRWAMKCSTPPIYFTLSSAQYQQVVQASAAWASSATQEQQQKPAKLVRQSAAADVKTKHAPATHVVLPEEFEPNDEKFTLGIHIPQILVVLEGGGGMPTSEGPNATTDTGHEIDLVLDVRLINVEAKFSSDAQAVGANFRRLSFYKRKSTRLVSSADAVTRGGKKPKLTTAEAIAQVNAEESNSRTSSLNDQPADPDPAFHPETGESSSKLIEIGQRVTFMMSSIAPFKAKISAQQVSLYWDHDLLTAMFRSYLWGNSVVAKSAPSSTSSSRTSSGSSQSGRSTDAVDLSAAAAGALVDDEPPPAPFSIEIRLEKCYIFLRPHDTHSSRFAIKLSVRDIRCLVSSLAAPTHMLIQIQAKSGVQLESSRFVVHDDTRSGDEVCELLRTDNELQVEVEVANSYGSLAHRNDAATYVGIQASSVEVNFVHAHFQVLFEHLNKQVIGFFSWVGEQFRPGEIKVTNNRTKLDVRAETIKMLLPRGVVGNPIERQRKPERMEVDVKKLTISSRKYPKDQAVEQLLMWADDIQLASFLVDESRDHTDAVASIDEAVSRAQETGVRRAQERSTVLLKTTILHQPTVFVDHVSMPIPRRPRKKKKDLEPTEMKASDQPAKVKRVLDIEDIANAFDNYCRFVRVSLSRPDDWDPIGRSTQSGTQKRPPQLNLPAKATPIQLAVEQQQIELFACILDENFSRLELRRRPPPEDAAKRQEDDEKQIIDVQVDIGEVSLSLLRPSGLGTRAPDHVEDVASRVVGRIDLDSVHVSVYGFASSRSQQRIVASRARFWSIDAIKSEADSSIAYRGVECGELYIDQANPSLHQCVDITIDQHGNGEAATLPLEIRLHVFACALRPSFATLITRALPFLAIEPAFQGYVKKKGSPVNVSVTTGMIHCMLAEHLLVTDSSGDGSTSTVPLHLVLSGCVVLRYSDANEGLKHVQAFGRKMSVEISAQWPPLSDESSSDSVPPSPTATPTYGQTTPRKDSRSRSTSSAQLPRKFTVAMESYQRVLCDDFAVDLDLVDTTLSDNTLKISTSLTHFHAVLCTVDIFMISQIQKLIETIAIESSKSWGSSSRTSSRVSSRSSTRSQRTTEHDSSSRSSSAVSSTALALVKMKQIVVNMMLEDASVTFVREIGEYFSPLARVYTFCTMCNVIAQTPLPLLDASALPSSSSSKTKQIVEVHLHFTEDSEGELRDDEGLSAWAFNAVLGSWEPIIEPWMFTMVLRLETDATGNATTKIDIAGSDSHSFNVNFSPRLLDSFCAITKEIEPLIDSKSGKALKAATASVISCGFYLANDTGVNITYWVSDHGSAAASHSRSGFTYANRLKHAPEELMPRHKVPLKLSTAIFPSVQNDQTMSFSWGDDEWYPLTDVRIHSAGKYVYSVLAKANVPSRTSSRTGSGSMNPQAPGLQSPPKVLLALFDISAVFGYRTLTVSSLMRVFNEADVPIDCAVLSDDGKTITEFGTIDPQEACGVPITMIRSLAGVRVLIRPHALTEDSQSPAATEATTAEATSKGHRWSNELFINEKEELQETVAACSLVLDDYDCKCQRMFDGSQPLHVSQNCRANGSFFRVGTRVFTASNGSSLKYAQLRVYPALSIENKCGVPIFIVAFVFKKVRRAGVSQDREYSHIVATETIPPHGGFSFLSSSLQESTYCSVSLTGFSWSKLFLLPSVFPNVTSAASAPSASSSTDSPRQQNALAAMMGGSTSQPSSPSSQRTPLNGEILCRFEDFKSRKASVHVTLHGSTSENALRRVVIQPKYLIRNETKMPLTFEPSIKAKNKMPGPKSFFSLPSSPASKQASNCCGSPQLEMIHTKLNALHGATTTSATPNSSTGTRQARAKSQENASGSGDEREHFYCSETNLINIQVEGNTMANSGVLNFRLDAAVGGTNSTIRLFDESKQQWHDIVVILEQVDAVTTKATFVERYVFLNRTDFNLVVVPACDLTGTTAQEPTNSGLLKSHTSTAYHWSLRTAVPSDPTIRIKVSDPSVTGWRWSGRFSLHDVSETALKLSSKYTSQVHVIRVEVRVESALRVFVVLSSEDTAPYPLYRVVNSSSHEIIHFKQSFEGGSGELSEQSAVTLVDYSRGVTQRLFPGESLCFGWDEGYFLQSLERVVEISYSSDGARTKVLLDQPAEAQRVDLPATKTKPQPTCVYVHWYLNGVTKTIQVHDTQLPRDKLTGKPNHEAANRTSGAISRMAPVVAEMALRFKMPNMMLSILNSTPEEVLLFTAEKFDFKYASSRGQHDEFEVKIGSFQLDNQLSNAVFPVVFTPTPNNGSASSRVLDSPTRQPTSPTNALHKPSTENDDKDGEHGVDTFFHLSILRLSYGEDVDYLKYLSAMVQPARLQIDDFLIISVALLSSDFIQVVQRYFAPAKIRRRESELEEQQAAREAAMSNAEAHEVDSTALSRRASSDEAAVLKKLPGSERRMYIETLELHPFKIQVTFQQNNLSKAPLFDDDGSATNFLLPVVFMVLKSNLVNIDSASINLNALHIYHSFTTRTFMLSAIQQHYAFQGILQVYSLLGSADILGNPLGLVKNLGTGVKDFFYEPMAGMVKSPREFALGLSRGTASLVKNSVYGTFNAASKFTGTLSSGIAALSMDGDYIKARNTRNRHEVPTHIGTGILYGTKQLGQGILAGVSGVITAPALGAYNNGLTGFVEGVGKGLIGVAVKPTAGILDLAAKATAGITATATVFDKKARDTRMRLPRMMHTSDKRLRVYSNDEAMICQLLHKLPQKLLRNEHYEAHVFLPLSRAVVATSHQFFHADFSSLTSVMSSHPRITWKFSLSSVWGAQKSAKGVSIFIGAATHVSLTSTTPKSSQSAPSSPQAGHHHHHHPGPTVTKSTMTTVLVPLKESESAVADQLVKCISSLVAKQRERAPVSETFSSPIPRNAIGMVLEPVRDSNKVPGYEGYGGRVVDVFVGSACYRAGVEVGDVIVGFGTHKFEAGDHGSALRTQLSLMKKGDTLQLMVLRHGEIKYISVVTE